MKDELISFETAKLAKEKGFNWETLLTYNNKKLEEYASNYNLDVENVDEVRLIHLYYNFNGMGGNYISAPTQSLLQRWLREEYNFHIYIEPHNNKSGMDYTPYLIIAKYDIQGSKSFDLEKTITSYEEALEIALQEALKLIPIN
ncbi:hypothetical protein Phi18:3_gp024 [Cellulophaga phage phi18:3]|uniref:Uncharacterized protein n=1 Tax=Cellulophaga phage phi18:3 TaxID=1327983 RepID=R9ZZM4_9CAUD|nr:hypothetical protein Phi18:3_gp024 [Cellulophaga phage phi18:3]AGO48536.1 hypothetical protein Phi18:3_gp024 [Cellulophaga phage phi18:3]